MQAKFITRWKDCYKRVAYMKEAISKQEKADILKSFKRANNEEDREHLLMNIIKPYFRLDEEKLPKRYHPRYMNKNE